MIFQDESHIQFIAINHSIPAALGISLKFITYPSPIILEYPLLSPITYNVDAENLRFS